MEDAAPSLAETYERLIADLCSGLRARDAGKRAPGKGQEFPDFVLPDADGALRRFGSFLEDGPVIVSFLRGQWCPYCAEELRSWDRAMPQLEASGAQLLCIVAATGGAALAIRQSVASGMEVLCDVDHGLALELGLAFFLGAPFLDRYKANGLDLAAIYGTAAGLLPIPATFAVGRDGIVRASFVEPDFRIRADPADMIAALDDS